MNKRRLHHFWTIFRRVKPWYFLAIALVSVFVCTYALRANNEKMVKLRSAVYATDQNDGNVVQALNNLRTYVNAHMNTNLVSGADAVYPPIQLKYTYSRLVAAESARVNSVNAQVYTDAQAYCEQQDPVDFSGHNRVPCIEDYVNTHGTKAQTVPEDLYKFSFASPTWSPDLAGWSMVIAVLSTLLFVASFIVQQWVKRYVK